MTQPTVPDPPVAGPSDETKAGFKSLFNEAMDEWVAKKEAEAAATPPTRTERPKTFLDDILNFGRA